MKLTWGADCLPGSITYLPQNIPAIWPYSTGSPTVRWPQADIDRFRKHGAAVFLVDQGYESQSPFDADEFDIEQGAWEIAQMPGIVAARRERNWSTRFYCCWTCYGQIKQLLAGHGTGQSVFFRIADWDLSAHLADLELHDDVYAGQWASPSSNRATLIPGTRTTLSHAGVDLNVLLIEDTGWQG